MPKVENTVKSHFKNDIFIQNCSSIYDHDLFLDVKILYNILLNENKKCTDLFFIIIDP